MAPPPTAPPSVAPVAPQATGPMCSVKMRALHWAKLPPALLSASVWAQVSAEEVAVDLTETEALFAAPQPKLARQASSSGAPGALGRMESESRLSGEDPHNSCAGANHCGEGGGGLRRQGSSGVGGPPPQLHVITVPRATNVGIFLKKVSKLLSVDQLCTAVLRMEAAVLEPDLLESILANLPGEPEAKQLRALKVDDPSTLAPPERFCFQMARLPRLRSMLHALRLRFSLPASLARARAGLETVGGAARQLMNSRAFVRLLASILNHGNVLNSGTPRAAARGIKLDGLDKARAVKSADGKCSLLEHACRATQLTEAEIRADLGGVRAACRLPLVEIIRIIQDVEEGVDNVHKEIALCPVPDLAAEVAADAASAAGPGEAPGLDEEQLVALRFRQAMGHFSEEVQRDLDDLVGTREEVKNVLTRLASWLGESAATADADAILRACADLVDTAVACAPRPAPSPRTVEIPLEASSLDDDDDDDQRNSYF